MPKLKVYRTPIGFHDAYVAAPSQKAALEAWGTSKNLFARGVAELVTDAALTSEPLASPGKVVKRARSSNDEPTREKAKPPPDRSALRKAERLLEEARARQRQALGEIDRRLAKLQDQRRALIKAQAAEIAKLEKRRDDKNATYRRALGKWKD